MRRYFRIQFHNIKHLFYHSNNPSKCENRNKNSHTANNNPNSSSSSSKFPNLSINSKTKLMWPRCFERNEISSVPINPFWLVLRILLPLSLLFALLFASTIIDKHDMKLYNRYKLRHRKMKTSLDIDIDQIVVVFRTPSRTDVFSLRSSQERSIVE